MQRRFMVLLMAPALGACQASTDSGSLDGKTKAANKDEKPGIFRVLKPEPVVVPEGTVFPLVLETAASSGTSKAGDLVVAKLAADVRVGEKIVLPAGTEFRGQVTAAVRSGRVSGRARLAFDFDRLTYKGKEREVDTRAIDITAPNDHKRDAAVIGGGTAGGAIVGAIAGGKKGAGIGALIGAGAGTGTVLATKGHEVTLPAGTRWNARLLKDLRLE